ncbi:transcriptional regulator with PAS, ATPase and Fis domain [Clostridium tetanomorphum]|uniref:Sigma 54-interacting transcriptional regulator n=1 Tax=Clostridium tetanomorphum TaxID=1553 RepID=A0A923J262_CLOTT|nr:sigma 54-interacting transcriptional regulator [Clostridium tetanomorphum]KAJ52177.1 sigma-54 dependent transcriptional regulator [Clostridium tetanomorphum DSM 665]MBC2399927.1 sigma 54-interacting transcriptional regulator [Clostridium tetanomorphum]MBP1866426.1 transcriptional regulator with PAS, ATPase and Fis domain [Clostridium tetanomorphum]NRS86772.1 transcriptional regulator with PAS, ATPase and Fis domain [Clostridium tetanomorphum]NRZ99473.1 transcriptional regulator with PAS, AT
MINVNKDKYDFNNITDYESLKKKLIEERNWSEMLRIALDMAYEGVVIVNKDGYINTISKAYADFLGVDDKEVIGKHITEVIENTRLHIIAKTGKVEEAQLQKVGCKYMIANRNPIIIDGEIKGAVGKVLFRNVKELDFLYKKFSKVQKELEDYKEEIQQQNSARYSFSDIVGNGDGIMEAKKLAKKAALTDSNVLLTGESGTGKELFAHAIHKNSNRVYGHFIKVNCAAIPSDLLESELFGYEKGAFTGAKKEGKMGKFELADGGTIFLDEIGDMPLHMQVKLLRVLQEKEVERVGAISPKNIDIRIIAATNQDLEHMIKEGKFRADLYYRLNVVTIKIPPLRERKEDIILLAKFLSSKISKKLNRIECEISDEALEYLKNYRWEGNVRQLENAIERAINIMEDNNEVLLPKHLPKEITGIQKNINVSKLEDIISEAERNAIINAIKACSGNKLKAAKTLGISRTTLYEKINKHKIFLKF